MYGPFERGGWGGFVKAGFAKALEGMTVLKMRVLSFEIWVCAYFPFFGVVMGLGYGCSKQCTHTTRGRKMGKGSWGVLSMISETRDYGMVTRRETKHCHV